MIHATYGSTVILLTKLENTVLSMTVLYSTGSQYGFTCFRLLVLVHQRGYRPTHSSDFCMIVQIYIAILSYIILPYSVIRPHHHAFVAKAFAWPVSMRSWAHIHLALLWFAIAHGHASCHPYVMARSRKSVMIASASLSTDAVAVISSPYLTKPSESRNS